MTNEKFPVSNEFITFVRIQLDYEQKQQLTRYLNLHYLGDVNANKLDDSGRYIAKYPEKETEEFKDALWRINADHEYQVKVVYSVDGKCKLELI